MVKDNKVNLEDKEQLFIFKSSDSYRTVLKLLNLLVESQTSEVLKVDLNVKSDRDLAFAKARAEGATKLLSEFNNYLVLLSKRQVQEVKKPTSV